MINIFSTPSNFHQGVGYHPQKTKAQAIRETIRLHPKCTNAHLQANSIFGARTSFFDTAFDGISWQKKERRGALFIVTSDLTAFRWSKTYWQRSSERCGRQRCCSAGGDTCSIAVPTNRLCRGGTCGSGTCQNSSSRGGNQRQASGGSRLDISQIVDCDRSGSLRDGNTSGSSIQTGNGCRQRRVSAHATGGGGACVTQAKSIACRCVLRHSELSRSSQGKSFRHSSANCVVLISRQCHSSQNTNDRHNDHQFDQGKTLLQIAFHKILQESNFKSNLPKIHQVRHIISRLHARSLIHCSGLQTAAKVNKKLHDSAQPEEPDNFVRACCQIRQIVDVASRNSISVPASSMRSPPLSAVASAPVATPFTRAVLSPST